MNKYIVHASAESAEQNQTDHPYTQRPNKVQIAHAARVHTQHTVINDSAHDLRLQQIHQHLTDHKCRRDDSQVQVPLHIFPHFYTSLCRSW